MQLRFILFRRGNTHYCEDTNTGQQTSLRTKDTGEAQTLLNARNESVRQPVLNLQIARTYLAASDSGVAIRTWKQALDTLIGTKRGGPPNNVGSAQRAMQRWIHYSRGR